MSDWYAENIEPEVRDLVKLLRDHGVNTVSSCGHDLEIQADIYADNELRIIDTMLFNAGYWDYTITAYIERVNGHLHQFVEIKLHKKHLEVGKDD